MTLLERATVVDDAWVAVGDDDELPPGAPAIVSLARFRRDKAALAGRNAALGVFLEGAQAGEDLADVAAAAQLVAIRFAVFRDGRGFSIARALRQRHGFKGVLRATGHILPDQHLFLLRCGFDQVAVPSDDDLPAWREAVGAFHFAYQPSALDEEPATGLRRLRPGALRSVP